jgi:hypothetical protein
LYFTLDKPPKITDFVNEFEHRSIGNKDLFFGFDRLPLVEKAAKFGGRKRICRTNFTLTLDIKFLEELAITIRILMRI